MLTGGLRSFSRSGSLQDRQLKHAEICKNFAVAEKQLPGSKSSQGTLATLTDGTNAANPNSVRPRFEEYKDKTRLSDEALRRLLSGGRIPPVPQKLQIKGWERSRSAAGAHRECMGVGSCRQLMTSSVYATYRGIVARAYKVSVKQQHAS